MICELKSRLQRWEETSDSVAQLETWLAELTGRLDAAPEPTADLAQLRATLERLTVSSAAAACYRVCVLGTGSRLVTAAPPPRHSATLAPTPY